MTSIETQVSDSLTTSPIPPFPPLVQEGRHDQPQGGLFRDRSLLWLLASAGLADFPVVILMFVMELTRVGHSTSAVAAEERT